MSRRVCRWGGGRCPPPQPPPRGGCAPPRPPPAPPQLPPRGDCAPPRPPPDFKAIALAVKHFYTRPRYTVACRAQPCQRLMRQARSFFRKEELSWKRFKRGAGCAARLFYGDRACSPTRLCKEQLIRSLLQKAILNVDTNASKNLRGWEKALPPQPPPREGLRTPSTPR